VFSWSSSIRAIGPGSKLCSCVSAGLLCSSRPRADGFLWTEDEKVRNVRLSLKSLTVWLSFIASLPLLILDSINLIGLLKPIQDCGLDCGVFVPSVPVLLLSWLASFFICLTVIRKLQGSIYFCWLACASYCWMVYSLTYELISNLRIVGSIDVVLVCYWIAYLVLGLTFCLHFIVWRARS
jgi:hypothetical protein